MSSTQYFMFDSETWTLASDTKKRLESCEMCMVFKNNNENPLD